MPGSQPATNVAASHQCMPEFVSLTLEDIGSRFQHRLFTAIHEQVLLKSTYGLDSEETSFNMNGGRIVNMERGHTVLKCYCAKRKVSQIL
jgi:hypothetical protein